jgi:hypothetical protein
MALKGPRDLSSDALRAKIKEMNEEIEHDISLRTGDPERDKLNTKLIDMRRAVISECKAELKRRDEQ